MILINKLKMFYKINSFFKKWGKNIKKFIYLIDRDNKNILNSEAFDIYNILFSNLHAIFNKFLFNN